MEEIWKDIDPEGIYKISNLGRVRTTIRQGCSVEFLKPIVNYKGYLTVDLRWDGKRHHATVHRLVALAFIPNPNNYPEINHKDEDKTNNRVDNLEWCDHWYNIHYGTGIERGKEAMKKDVNQYDKQGNFIKCWHGVSSAASALKIDSSCIVRCCNGETRTYRGFIWLYVDDPALEDKLSARLAWLGEGHHARYGQETPIRQYTLDGIFVAEYPSLREAERVVGANSGHLSKRLKKVKSVRSKGYLWSKS